ncbi:MAG: T9SS type A sorting domain-containing protein [Bacteroidetes bacterium]|nr:MAG: T9SS type A sorting domain-containing protein [Bacteroidota bacterium]
MMILKPFAVKKTLFFLLCFWFNVSLLGQNLVPNFGFNQNTDCPTTGDQVDFCTGWSKYCTSGFTPDYFNACAPANTMSVPNSFFIYQPDHRNCGGYMGLVTWSQTVANEREHIGVQLGQTLVIGQKYYLSFYTVRGGFNDNSDNPSNNIGMRLSTVSHTTSNPAPINNFAHLRSATIISDTVNWTRVSGSIVADSAYQYLMVGNFFDDANTDTTTLNCGSCINYLSYYLIDDVCISTDSSLCNGGIDALPCTASIEEYDIKNQFSFYPNPANDFVTIISNLEKTFDIELYNAVGKLLYAEENVNAKNLKLDISQYNNGLLFVKINSQNNQFMYKLLKQ